MTIKQHLAFSIDYSGLSRELCTHVLVAAPTLTQPFNPNKQFAKFDRAIWDTGATCTVITKKVVAGLGLEATGMAPVSGVNSQSIVPTYVVDILLPNNVLIQNVNVLEGNISANFDVLIGMDIIQRGDMAISNANGKTKFTFCIPSHEHPICLVEKSNKVNERLQKKKRLHSITPKQP